MPGGWTARSGFRRTKNTTFSYILRSLLPERGGPVFRWNLVWVDGARKRGASSLLTAVALNTGGDYVCSCRPLSCGCGKYATALRMI